MALRAPQNLATVVNPKTGLSMMEAEIQAETATSLGHHGRKVEKALVLLDGASEETRDDLMNRAAQAVWEYFIQRELMGLRDHRWIIREMGIPDPVLKRLGSIR